MKTNKPLDKTAMIKNLQIADESFFETIRISNRNSADGFDYYVVSATPDKQNEGYIVDIYRPFIRENSFMKEIPTRAYLTQHSAGKHNYYYECTLLHKSASPAFTHEIMSFIDSLAALCSIGGIVLNETPSPELSKIVEPLGYTAENGYYTNNHPQFNFYEDYIAEIYDQATRLQTTSERV